MSVRDGSVLFGYCIDVLLYGILTVQAYIYYLSFPGDRRLTKVTVAFIYAVGTIQTAFALHDFYSLFCLFNEASYVLYDWDGLHSYGFMWITIPLSGASVAAVSQLFYAQRIHLLSGKKLIPGVVILLAFVQFTIGVFISFTSYSKWAIHDGKLFPVTFLSRNIDALGWELSGTICDLVITIYMFRFLSRHIQRSKVFRSTRVSLTRIKRLTLESGLVTTGVAITYIVLSLLTDSTAFIIPGLALSKVYGNSMLALLNSRLSIPGGRKEIDPVYSVDHLAIEERQTEFQQDESVHPSVSA